MRYFFISVLCLVSFGCSSIPFSTMLALRSFDQADFLNLQPAQLKTKVLIHEPVKIDVQSIRLTLDAETNHGIRQYRFPLVLISEQTIAPQNGLFLKAPAQTAYTFKMAEEARLSFGEVQAALQRQNPHRFEFSVDADFEPIPESIETATLSVLLKLSEEKDFFPLLEDVEIDLKNKS